MSKDIIYKQFRLLLNIKDITVYTLKSLQKLNYNLIMNNFFENLLKDTTHKVHHLEQTEKDVLKRAFSTTLILVDANLRLKNFIINYEFKNIEEEIYFFKQAKPLLISQLIYYCQLYKKLTI